MESVSWDAHLSSISKHYESALQSRSDLLLGFEKIDVEDDIATLYREKSTRVTEELYALASGPDARVFSCPGCSVNGVRFHTSTRDGDATQNCGLFVKGNHEGDGEFEFYGIITDIIELKYIRDNQVALFKCEWFDIDNKKRVGRISDQYFTSINCSKRWYKNDPFVLPEQARQVFYVADTKLGKDWFAVQEFQHRHILDAPDVESFGTD
ncbi:hypothetical protein AKJ16_DCAP14964 [Drosera capensis]